MKIYAVIAALGLSLSAEMALAQPAPQMNDHLTKPAASEVHKTREGRVQKGEKRTAKRLVNKDRKPAKGKAMTSVNPTKKQARQHKQKDVAKVKRVQTPSTSVTR